MLFSCNSIEEKKERNKELSKIDIKTYVETGIDSCEYFVMKTADAFYIITHKGNCKNPIHYKKIVYDTVEYQIIKKK